MQQNTIQYDMIQHKHCLQMLRLDNTIKYKMIQEPLKYTQDKQYLQYRITKMPPNNAKKSDNTTQYKNVNF